MEYARNVAGISDAGHAEVDATATPVVVPLTCLLVGDYREVRTVPGTKAAATCGNVPMFSYHSCGYGLAAHMTPVLEATGLVVSGYADDGTVEIVELPEHPFFLATLFQPQVSPDESELHPLLAAFADAIVNHHRLAMSAR